MTFLNLQISLILLSGITQLYAESRRFAISRDVIECVRAHNIARSRHNAPEVQWDEQLAYDAQLWAILSAKRREIMSTSFDVGENNFALWGKNKPTFCDVAVDDWYKGEKRYDYKHPGYDEDSASFSQVVWKGSRKIGAGIAFDPVSRNSFIVVRYAPGGNIIGQFKNQVAPPKPGTATPTLKDFTMPKGRFTSYLMVDVSQKQPCEDISKSCTYFLKLDYCTKGSYVQWMKVNCRKSCEFCKPGPPVNGGWSSWVSVSECEESRILQHRYCINPEPSEGGRQCIGEKMRVVSC